MKNCTKKLNSFLCGFLAVIVLLLSVVPASAAGFGGDTPYNLNSDKSLTLDNDTVLSVPSMALDGDFLVVKYASGGRYQYFIYQRLSGVMFEGKTCTYRLWNTDKFSSNLSALAATNWTGQNYVDTEVVIVGKGSSYSIVYSSFNFKTGPDKNGFYWTYYPASSSGSDEPVGDMVIRPARNYDNVFPSVSTVTTNRTDNWVILRECKSSASDNNKWRYWLYFLSDDYSAAVQSTYGGVVARSVDGTIKNVPWYYGQLKISASTIYEYELDDSTFPTMPYVNDTTLASAASPHWSYENTLQDSDASALTAHLSKAVAMDSDAYSSWISNCFVASNVSFEVAASGPWQNCYYDDADNLHDLTYNLPSISIVKSSFVARGETVDTGDSESGIIAWLKKIYNAIVDGFNGLTGGGGSKDDVPDDPIVPPDQDGDGGFSLLDVLNGVWDFIKSLLGGLWKLVSGAVTRLLSSIGDLFDLIGDKVGGLFDFFQPDEDGNTPFDDLSSFFTFMQNLWLCIPAPIRFVITFAFSMFIVFALLKMFH